MTFRREMVEKPLLDFQRFLLCICHEARFIANLVEDCMIPFLKSLFMNVLMLPFSVKFSFQCFKFQRKEIQNLDKAQYFDSRDTQTQMA